MEGDQGNEKGYRYSVGLSRKSNISEVYSPTPGDTGDFELALSDARSKADHCHWIIFRFIPNRVGSGVIIAQSKKDGDNLKEATSDQI